MRHPAGHNSPTASSPATGPQPLDLPLHLRRIDRPAHVVGADQPPHRHMPRLAVDVHLRRLRTVAVGDVGVALAGSRRIGSRRPRVKDILGARRALFIRPLAQRRLSRALYRVAGHERHARGRCAAGGTGDVRVVRAQFNLSRIDTQRLGGDALKHRMRPLSDIRAHAADYGPLDLVCAVQFHPGAARLRRRGCSRRS